MSGKSAVARNLASIAERNLTNLALQATRELNLAETAEDREQIAIAGLYIAQARQVILPFVLGAK